MTQKDFNGDGKTDVLWYNSASGIVGAWLLDGTEVIRRADLSWNSPGSNGWQPMGTGDFNRDGKTDVLWYHPDSGVVGTWLVDGTTVLERADLDWTAPGAEGWEIKGTGDFNNDGNIDVLWYQPSSGIVGTWLMNGTTVIKRADLDWTVPGSEGWELMGTGDFDNNGNIDVLWYHPSSGIVGAWLMNGTTVIKRADLSWQVPGSEGWKIVSR